MATEQRADRMDRDRGGFGGGRGGFGGDRGDRGFGGDRGGKGEGGARPFFGRSRRPRPPSDMRFDYKDVETLRQFITETGKIVPRRISRLSAKQQRQLTVEIKRARILAMLPFSKR